MQNMKTLALAAALVLGAAFSQLQAQSFGDTIWNFPPGACGGGASANGVAPTGVSAVGTGLTVVGTASLPVFQVASSAAATDTISCTLDPPSRSFAGKGASIAGVAFYYGITGTAATSESAPACGTLAAPNPSATETPTGAALTAITVTSIPVVGSFNAGTVTAGQLLSTYLSFSASQALNTNYLKVVCTWAFGQTAGSAMQIYTPGGTIFGTNTIAWLRKHSRAEDLEALTKYTRMNRTESLRLLAAYHIGKKVSVPAVSMVQKGKRGAIAPSSAQISMVTQ